MYSCSSISVILVFYILGSLISFPFINSISPSSYNPLPNPLSIITYKSVRFTLLTDSLVRIQWSPNITNTNYSDDATFAVVNRYLPQVNYTLIPINSTSIMINTSSITIIYNDNMTQSINSNTCNGSSGYDQSGGVRVPEYPNGTIVNMVDECCNLCRSLSSCISWVYATDSKGNSINCWLMSIIRDIHPASQRILGNNTKPTLTGNNLRIYMKNNTQIWTPETVQTGYLNGTYEHLDCYTTPTDCYQWSWQQMNPSLLSTEGWTLFDDSNNTRLLPSTNKSIDGGIPMYANSTIGINFDWYFSTYTDYRQALNTWSLILGTAELVPRAFLGTFWSQNFPWTNTSTNDSIVTGILDNYYDYEIPLSILVLDMDWHVRHQEDPNCATWGSWDFNLSAFPNPSQFINYLHSENSPVGHPLMLTLNVHPQTGVDHCMLKYQEIAKILNFDASTNATIPCDMGNRSFVNALWASYYNSEPLNLMDFAWTDYTGCGNFPSNTLLWSNFIYAWERNLINDRRPVGFSRNGGIGNHRYPIGFSGDTFQHELTLDFEIQTTSLAANSLFGYWSHDIGGFHGGSGSPGTSNITNTTGAELYLRWLQFASVAPIFRTHCGGCGPDPSFSCACERRIWLFSSHFYFMRDAFRLRNALLPYLYTEAKYYYDTGIAYIRPLYYDYPMYYSTIINYPHQYNFGLNIIVSPISGSMNGNINGMINKTMWIPPGNWSQFLSGTVITSDGTIIDNRNYHVNEIPMFVKTKSIIPLATNNTANIAMKSPGLMFMMYAQSIYESNIAINTTVYEDDGISTNYYTSSLTSSLYTTSGYEWDIINKRLYFIIYPAVGSYPNMPSNRPALALQIRGYQEIFLKSPSQILVNQQPIPKSSIPNENNCSINCWYIMPNYNIYQSLVYPYGSLNIFIGRNIPFTEIMKVEIDFS